jgi:hypothetical protein
MRAADLNRALLPRFTPLYSALLRVPRMCCGEALEVCVRATDGGAPEEDFARNRTRRYQRLHRVPTYHAHALRMPEIAHSMRELAIRPAHLRPPLLPPLSSRTRDTPPPLCPLTRW